MPTIGIVWFLIFLFYQVDNLVIYTYLTGTCIEYNLMMTFVIIYDSVYYFELKE